LKLS
jgi:esterase/lipase